MDHQTQIVEKTNVERERLKEELITVYLRLDKLPSDSLPVPKASVVPSYTGHGVPAQSQEP
eukprot:3227322-Amphidinium_carterae.1